MNNPTIEPTIKNGGSAFRGCSLNATHPRSHFQDKDKVSVASLTEWCGKNFISKRVGRTLIKKKLLIGWRQFGQWWVTANLDCLEELLDYLGVDELAFDVEQE